jgi:hypothetical protein
MKPVSVWDVEGVVYALSDEFRRKAFLVEIHKSDRFFF